MSKIIAILITTGAGCISPISHAQNTTTVMKVPCAEVIYAPVANPFKIAQEQNAMAVVPASPPQKKRVSRLCSVSKKAVWYKKNGKRRYKCR